MGSPIAPKPMNPSFTCDPLNGVSGADGTIAPS